jgi:hypothetical protein
VIIKNKIKWKDKKNLGGSEGRVGTLSGLRRHEPAAGECCVTVELTRVHGSSRFDERRRGREILNGGVIEEKCEQCLGLIVSSPFGYGLKGEESSEECEFTTNKNTCGFSESVSLNQCECTLFISYIMYHNFLFKKCIFIGKLEKELYFSINFRSTNNIDIFNKFFDIF